MLNIVKHFWLLITVKRYIRKYKLKVKISNHFNSLRITTATNCLYFITLTHFEKAYFYAKMVRVNERRK